MIANRERHGFLRKHLAHGFSERALREQDIIIRGYADLCVQRLKEKCMDGTQPVDMVRWLNVSGSFSTSPVKSTDS